MDKYKVICGECGWNGVSSQVLRAPNPFLPPDEILGCPRCKSINTMSKLCEENGCLELVSAGTPTTDGYVFHCYRHPPTNAKTA